MSKHFEEARLVITADVVYDPDDVDGKFHEEMMEDMHKIFQDYVMLYKNIDVKLEGFICDDK